MDKKNPMDITVQDLRPEVADFALEIERVLRAEGNQVGWLDSSPLFLAAKLAKEIGDLNERLTVFVGLYENSETPFPYLARTIAGETLTEAVEAAIMLMKVAEVVKVISSMSCAKADHERTARIKTKGTD